MTSEIQQFYFLHGGKNYVSALRPVSEEMSEKHLFSLEKGMIFLHL